MNPGRGPTIRAAFKNDQESWDDSADLVELLTAVLTERAHTVTRDGGCVRLSSGLVLRPQVVSFEPEHPKGVQTSSTIEFSHPVMDGRALFEYQHSHGPDLQSSFRSGFDLWAQLDLATILDALGETPTASQYMIKEWPASETRARPFKRRLVLGPTAHWVADGKRGEDEAHPFCPCCLFTSSFEAFLPLLETDRFFGIRFFALRDSHGDAQADCRVDGEDFEPGRLALLKYVETWPARGFEFRKQYVVMQTV